MGATCTRKLSTKRRFKSSFLSSNCSTGLCKWLLQSSTFMIEKFCIEIWKLKTFSWLHKEKSKLETLGLLEYSSTHMTAQRQPLEPLITYLQKYVKSSLTTKNLIFGLWVAYCMRWWHWNMLLTRIVWKDLFWRFFEELILRSQRFIAIIWEIWFLICWLKSHQSGLQYEVF